MEHVEQPEEETTQVPIRHFKALVECAEAIAVALEAMKQRERAIAKMYLETALQRLERVGFFGPRVEAAKED